MGIQAVLIILGIHTAYTYLGKTVLYRENQHLAVINIDMLAYYLRYLFTHIVTFAPFAYLSCVPSARYCSILSSAPPSKSAFGIHTSGAFLLVTINIEGVST